MTDLAALLHAPAGLSSWVAPQAGAAANLAASGTFKAVLAAQGNTPPLPLQTFQIASAISSGTARHVVPADAPKTAIMIAQLPPAALLRQSRPNTANVNGKLPLRGNILPVNRPKPAAGPIARGALAADSVTTTQGETLNTATESPPSVPPAPLTALMTAPPVLLLNPSPTAAAAGPTSAAASSKPEAAATPIADTAAPAVPVPVLTVAALPGGAPLPQLALLQSGSAAPTAGIVVSLGPLAAASPSAPAISANAQTQAIAPVGAVLPIGFPSPAAVARVTRTTTTGSAKPGTAMAISADPSPALSNPLLASPGALTNAALPASSAANPAVPPQDFASLVDRLVEARSAAFSDAGPQMVGAAVNHAEFGKVSLDFQQDGAQLSVSMTSADPGFARAAQSAITAHARPTASVQTAAGNPAQAATEFSGGGGGSQSQTQAQHLRLAHIAPATRSARAGNDAAAASPATGIFA
jgi:hypothetical protein